MPLVRCMHKLGKVERVNVNFAEDKISDVLARLHQQLKQPCPLSQMVACVNNNNLYQVRWKDLDMLKDVTTPQDGVLADLGLRVSSSRRLAAFRENSTMPRRTVRSSTRPTQWRPTTRLPPLSLPPGTGSSSRT
jgi:hypothetical protein